MLRGSSFELFQTKTLQLWLVVSPRPIFSKTAEAEIDWESGVFPRQISNVSFFSKLVGMLLPRQITAALEVEISNKPFLASKYGISSAIAEC